MRRERVKKIAEQYGMPHDSTTVPSNLHSMVPSKDLEDEGRFVSKYFD
jgi:hypothetical protein